MEWRDLNAIADPIHFFDERNYQTKMMINEEQIQVVKTNDNQEYLLIKKDENYTNHPKYPFLTLSEKAFNLIHPSVLRITGYNINKPYIFYESVEYQKINEVELSDLNMQMIFYGIATGLEYLISNGFFFIDFSINSIIFVKNNFPKLIDYVNFEKCKRNTETELIIKYAEIIEMFIHKKKIINPEIQIDDSLESLIEKCKQKNDLPTFNDFIYFFFTSYYCMNASDDNPNPFSFTLSIYNVTLFARDINYYDKCETFEEIIYYFSIKKKR